MAISIEFCDIKLMFLLWFYFHNFAKQIKINESRNHETSVLNLITLIFWSIEKVLVLNKKRLVYYDLRQKPI